MNCVVLYPRHAQYLLFFFPLPSNLTIPQSNLKSCGEKKSIVYANVGRDA